MTWLAILTGLVSAVQAFAQWLGNNQLIDAGKAETTAAGLQKVLNDIAQANAARAAVSDAFDRAATTGKLPDDGFSRD